MSATLPAPGQPPPEASRIEGLIGRLHGLHPRLIDLSLDRLLALLDKLGNPQRRLPPVIHVAGTNGKGSTCAFLRAIGEAAGQRVHVYTSPHLVQFNERIRLAGTLASDTVLADAFEAVERANAGAPITVFEVITAIAFHLFAAVPAELCVLEVGLGGRGDATNVIDRPAACAITSISHDHHEMLGDTLELIAAEKAGIIKPGVPVATGLQPAAALAVLRDRARAAGATLLARDEAWSIAPEGARGAAGGWRYADAAGALLLPPPALPGAHQVDNAGIAVAAWRAARLGGDAATITAGIAAAQWPARLQHLHGGLAGLLPAGWQLWLDGGHNPGAGIALAEHVATWRRDGPVHLLVGMKQAKDSASFLRPLLPLAASIWAVREPAQHLAMSIDAIIAASGGIAQPGPTVATALRRLAEWPTEKPARVLICGSLYLAGEVMKADQP